MADRVEQFLNDLDDPTKFVAVRDVEVFDEHDEPYWCLPDGRTEVDGEPVTRRTPGAVRRVRKFGPEELREIVDSCNETDAAGNFSPLSIGHIDPEEVDETKLPPQVGYAKGYRLGYSPRLNKQVILTDFYFNADDFESAQEYGAISIELWPGEKNIWPIALLKRAPQRSLPRWHYRRTSAATPSQFSNPRRRAARPGYVLRYSMEQRAMPDRYELDETESPDQFGADDGLDAPADGGEPTHDELQQFARHIFSHPHAAKCVKHYAMEDAPPADDLGDPTDPPDADAPIQNAAFPSSTNTGLPGGKAKPFQKNGKAPVRTVKQNAEATRYARMEAELAELKKESEGNRAKAARSDAERRVTQLLSEGFNIPDEEAEVVRYSKMPEAQRDEHETYFRSIAGRAPVQRVGRVDLKRTERPGDEVEEGDITKDHLDRALAYQKKKGCAFDEAVEQTAKKK